MPQFKEFYFDSCVPHKRIRAKSCTPDGSPKAVVQIAHGIAEHIDRYEDFMRFLELWGGEWEWLDVTAQV